MTQGQAEMHQEEIRAFLALDLPANVSRFLDDISFQLKKSRADVRWVNPTSIHLTLKFLGNVNRSRIQDIKNVMSPIFSIQRELELKISGIGALPNLSQPRVVWAGVSDPSGRLVKVVSSIEKAFNDLGFKRESRPFSPHLTLGRTRSNNGKERLVELINSTRSNVGLSFIADRAILFQSVLDPTGPLYNIVSVFNFIKSSSKQ